MIGKNMNMFYSMEKNGISWVKCVAWLCVSGKVAMLNSWELRNCIPVRLLKNLPWYSTFSNENKHTAFKVDPTALEVCRKHDLLLKPVVEEEVALLVCASVSSENKIKILKGFLKKRTNKKIKT